MAAKGGHEFAALDGLRGVAALSVVVFHYSTSPAGGHLFPNAYLAVDFFFLLSGFVISHAYEARLRSGVMSTLSFTRVRLTRLYPLYILGMSLAVLFYGVASVVFKVPHPSRVELAVSYVYGLAFLPALASIHFTTAAFPLNGPSWSLSAEMGINVIYAAIVKWLSNKILILVVIVAGVDLLWNNQFGGDQLSTFASGWERVCWSFPAGILLHRAFAARARSKYPAYVALGLVPVLVVAFSIPSSAVVRLGCSLLLFPVVVWIGAHVALRGRILSLANWSGAISYALYITHAAVGQLMSVIYRQYNWDANPRSWLRLLVWVTTAVLVAWALDVLFDRPVRALIGRVSPVRNRPSVGTPGPELVS
jgi:peptidoglycan/LPS O-acetylase OafA/YrhL